MGDLSTEKVIAHLKQKQRNHVAILKLQEDIQFYLDDDDEINSFLRANWNPHGNLIDSELTMVEYDKSKPKDGLKDIVFDQFIKKGEIPYAVFCGNTFKREHVGRRVKVEAVRFEGAEPSGKGFKVHWSGMALVELKNKPEFGRVLYRFNFVDFLKKPQ